MQPAAERRLVSARENWRGVRESRFRGGLDRMLAWERYQNALRDVRGIRSVTQSIRSHADSTVRARFLLERRLPRDVARRIVSFNR